MGELVKCDPQSCQYHQLTEIVMEDLKAAVGKLADSQMQVKETLVQLSEGFKMMDRIERQIEKEAMLQREKEKEQDKKIDDVRMFMYKSIGIGAVLLPLLTVVVQAFISSSH